MGPLIYWCVVASIGFAASLGSAVVGQHIYQYLRLHRPELVGSYGVERIRDWLLAIGLGCNLLTGIVTLLSKIHADPILNFVAISGLLGSATILMVFALLNFYLRGPIGSPRAS